VRSKATVILSTIVLVLLLVLVGGILFLKSDYAANRMCNFVRNSVRENLGLSTTIGSCSIDLLPPTLQSRRVQVETPDGGRLLDVSLLQVELDSLALLTGRFRIGKVFLKKPEIYLSVIDGAIANLPQVKRDPQAGPAQESTLLPEDVEVEGARLNLLLDGRALLQLRDMQARWIDKGRRRYELIAEVGGGSLDLVGGAGSSYSLKGCKLKAGLDPDGIRLDRLFVEMAGASIDARGTLGFASGDLKIKPDLSVRVVAPLEHLPDLVEGLPPMQGLVAISAQTRAAESGLQAEGDLEIKGFSLASAKDINLKARLHADSQTLKLQNLWISGPAGQTGWTLSGGLQLDLRDPWEYRGSLSLERVGLKDVFALAGLGSPPAAVRAEGTVGFRGKLKGQVGAYAILASRLGVKEFSIPPAGNGDPSPPILSSVPLFPAGGEGFGAGGGGKDLLPQRRDGPDHSRTADGSGRFLRGGGLPLGGRLHPGSGRVRSVSPAGGGRGPGGPRPVGGGSAHRQGHRPVDPFRRYPAGRSPDGRRKGGARPDLRHPGPQAPACAGRVAGPGRRKTE